MPTPATRQVLSSASPYSWAQSLRRKKLHTSRHNSTGSTGITESAVPGGPASCGDATGLPDRLPAVAGHLTQSLAYRVSVTALLKLLQLQYANRRLARLGRHLLLLGPTGTYTVPIACAARQPHGVIGVRS